MKILFVIESFPTYSETFIVNQIVDLMEKGHRIAIFCFRKGDKTITNSQINKLNKKVVYYKNSRTEALLFFIKNLYRINLKRFLQHPKFYIKNPVLLFDNKVDIIHCHFGKNAVKFDNIFFAKNYFSKSKKICTFHGYDMAPADIETNKIKYATIFKKFHVFTYNTPYLGDLLKKCYPNINSFEIPVGFNRAFLECYYKKYTKYNKFTILFCGRLIPLKGPQFLPEIARKLVNKVEDFEIKVIGGGLLKNELEKEIFRLNVESYIQLLGEQNQDVVFETMNRSHLLIMPGITDPETSREESQGLVIQEAQFFGLPVIVSDAGGMRYGMIDNETGFVVPQNDLDSFVEKISYLSKHKEIYTEMSVKAREYSLNTFDISKLNNKLIQLYNSKF